MKEIKAIIFDLDGTIADTVDAIQHGLNLTLRELGYPESTREEVLAHINSGAKHLIRLSLPTAIQNDEKKLDEILALYNRIYAKVYTETDKAYEGIPKVFTELSKRGYRLAILSNKQDAFVPTLTEQLLPKGSYLVALGQRPNAPVKPDPESAFEVASRLGVLPGECALVGDSNVDMMTAKNAGMLAVGVSWGYRSEEILREAGADIIVHKPLSLLDVFP